MYDASTMLHLIILGFYTKNSFSKDRRLYLDAIKSHRMSDMVDLTHAKTIAKFILQSIYEDKTVNKECTFIVFGNMYMYHNYFCGFRNYLNKKIKRKVQGVPQSQTAANPRHQEEEKKDKH